MDAPRQTARPAAPNGVPAPESAAERKAAVREEAATIASCVVLASLAVLYAGLCFGESFAKSAFLCVGIIIEVLFFAGFAFGLKPFHFMRAVAFAIVGFAIYSFWCEPEIFCVLLLVAPHHLALGFLSYKPPIWCSVLLGLFGCSPLVPPFVIFAMLIFYTTYIR